MPSLDVLTSSLGSNPYFGAGFGLLGVGTAAALLRRGLISAGSLLRRRAILRLEVADQDPSFRPLLSWMESRVASRDRTLVTRYVRAPGSSRSIPAFELVPGTGKHWFRHGGTLGTIERVRDRARDGPPIESLRVEVLASRSSAIAEILEGAHAAAEDPNLTTIYTSFGSEWRPFGRPRRNRPLESVIFPPLVAEDILADAKEFLRSSDWYSDRGIPYRRGYLFSGPPGCGKSSFAAALAGRLNLDICVLSLGETTLSNDRLAHLLGHAPPFSMILMEDVDTPVSMSASPTTSPLSLSGLLNALDGVTASEGRLLFMTTNRAPRELNPALIRAGRIDRTVCLGPATSAQAHALFVRFYGNDGGLASAFGAAGAGRSMAELQGTLLQFKESPRGAVAALGAST